MMLSTSPDRCASVAHKRWSGSLISGPTVRPADVNALVPPEHVVADVPIGRDTAAAPTVFARGGWIFVHLCQCVAAVTLVIMVARRRRARRGGRA